MSNKAELYPLFPSLVYVKSLTTELVSIDRFEFCANHINEIGTRFDLLEQPEFANLKAEVMDCLNEYFYNLMRVDTQTEIYITESWLNKTDPGDYHHRHRHSNSVLSGTIYLTEDAGCGNTIFQNIEYQQLLVDVTAPTQWNAQDFSVIPKVGRIVIFPSKLQHETGINNSDKPRYSIAFNTFVRGIISNSRTNRFKL